MIRTRSDSAREPRRNPRPSISAEQGKNHGAGFVPMIPVIRRQAKISFRKKGREEREELIEECVANAFRAYARLWELGKEELIYPSVLARYAVKQVREGRKVGGHLNQNEILSRYAQLRRRIAVERLDCYDAEDEEWKAATIEDNRTPIAEQVAFKMDFEHWLRQQRRPRRRIAEFLALGYTTTETARRFDVSKGRISQLRREFERSWKTYQGDAEECDRELAVA
jgi:hypothetical protein